MTRLSEYLLPTAPTFPLFETQYRQTPSPLSEQEVENILHRVTTASDKPKPRLVFERNEQVRIVDGPFANFTGVVEEVNADRSTLKISVSIFGRSTPVELVFAQVEKIAASVPNVQQVVNDLQVKDQKASSGD